jgi:hypothetical protein
MDGWIPVGEGGRFDECLQEKTSMTAAPRKPNKGAVSLLLKVEAAMGGGGGEDALGISCFSR